MEFFSCQNFFRMSEAMFCQASWSIVAVIQWFIDDKLLRLFHYCKLLGKLSQLLVSHLSLATCNVFPLSIIASIIRKKFYLLPLGDWRSLCKTIVWLSYRLRWATIFSLHKAINFFIRQSIRKRLFSLSAETLTRTAYWQMPKSEGFLLGCFARSLLILSCH